MDFQKFFDAMAESDRVKRGSYHVTLGDLIKGLAGLDQAAPITDGDGRGLGDFDSYRGYYADLAIEPADAVGTVGDLLAKARAALGETFTGYKGGDFTMGEEAPLWIASYGCCGPALVSISVGPEGVRLVSKEID